MFVVDLRLPPDDLVSQMSAIRVWLDGHGFETSGFSYEEGSDCAVARLAFRVRLEAEAFARAVCRPPCSGPPRTRWGGDHRRRAPPNHERRPGSGALSALPGGGSHNGGGDWT